MQIYLFLYLSVYGFFFLLIFSARNFSRFFLTSSIKLRELLDAQLTSCCLVQWLIHTGSLFLGSKKLSLFLGNTAFQGSQLQFHHDFMRWSKLDCSLLFS